MCSGYEHFSLINVLKCKTQVFILASSPCIGPQQAFFFKEEKYGFSIHFSTCELTDENVQYHKWHMLPLKADFMDSLRMYGKLPVTKLSKKWSDSQELSYYRDLRSSFFPSQQKSIYNKPANKYRQLKDKQPKNYKAFDEVEELKDALTGFLSARLDSDQKEELDCLVTNIESQYSKSQLDLKAQKMEVRNLKNQLSSKNYEHQQKEADLKKQLNAKDNELKQKEAKLKQLAKLFGKDVDQILLDQVGPMALHEEIEEKKGGPAPAQNELMRRYEQLEARMQQLEKSPPEIQISELSLSEFPSLRDKRNTRPMNLTQNLSHHKNKNPSR